MNIRAIIFLFLVLTSVNVFSQSDTIKESYFDEEKAKAKALAEEESENIPMDTYLKLVRSTDESLREIKIRINLLQKKHKVIEDSLRGCLNQKTEANSEVEPLNGILVTGKYYALIIGVQDYIDPEINDLDYPINDANELRDVLVNNYTFSKENVKVLENPDKDKIEEELEILTGKLSLDQDDNVLVFFAGHGFYNEVNSKGYWYASDAKKGSPRSWLSNSIIQDNLMFLSQLAKNVLLISDACFSGSILKMRSPFKNNTKTKAIKELYYTKTCKAMTSGANEPVDDKSKFLEYLVTYLKNNSKPYLRSRELHTNIEESVIGESTNYQKPQFGVVRESNDEGGDFIFIKRSK